MELKEERGVLASGMPTTGLFLLVGHPKTGKTQLAASFPCAYVLELESHGADHVAGRIHDIESMAEFRDAIREIVGDKNIKTVVIDTIDKISDWIEAEVASEMGLSSITERQKGVDGFEVWGKYRQRIEGLIGYLQASKKLVVLVAHCREPKLDAGGTLMTPAGINLPGKSGNYVAAQATLIGYMSRRSVSGQIQYVLSFDGGSLGIWGSRVSELNNKTLILPEKNPYSAIEAVFKKAEVKENVNNSDKGKHGGNVKRKVPAGA